MTLLFVVVRVVFDLGWRLFGELPRLEWLHQHQMGAARCQ